MVGSDQPGAD